MKENNIFTRHLKEMNENYFEHFLFAITTGMWMIAAGFVLLIHSFIPFFLPNFAGKSICKINQIMEKRKIVCTNGNLKKGD